MADDNQLRQDLLWRIEARRASVQAFLRAHRPRTRRRATITVVLSSMAAVFTAGPAFGGEPFAETVQDMFGLTTDEPVWRVLCLLALLVSVGAAVLTNLGKSQDDVARLSSAEAANAELEGLASLLQYGHLSVDDGVKLYQQYSVKIPFVDDQPQPVLHASPQHYPPQHYPPQYYTPQQYTPPAPGHYVPPPAPGPPPGPYPPTPRR
ncbi:hypothetical protein [Blastococcus sp. PRF04-17]|uniref:hypothetical protein n=1 Tax=Blastococcus sp. PRF04-17 TaxID=2933797 RepID=UPI001FF14B79|nr:hypothetical protein [Blastococcus sp. PRF04-17]UOY03848.1 hypothetical protein MVA48_11200 [Blastococcus sp. PRF04-17]